MNWRSQAGQDQFAAAVLGRTPPRSFLDIGAGDPQERNNTCALEELGWRGLCVERDPAMQARALGVRASRWWAGDALTADWAAAVYSVAGPGLVDYLSLDCDEATLPILGLMRSQRALALFRVLTVEHDAYRFGDGPRAQMRLWLKEAGYFLIAADVCDQGLPFEDWWVSSEMFPAAARFLSLNRDWRYVLSLA